MLQKNINNRTIFCRDNIEILRGVDSNTIDLIYLDPPFNKKKEFTAPIGSSAEGASFSDVFREEDVKDEWVKSIKEDYDGLYQFLNNVKNLSSITNLKANKHYLYNYCYLTYMAIRLVELKRILKNTGSIYLHCDTTMSHYLKILMDIIFGEKNFRNEILWCYAGGGIPKKDFPNKNDIILRYSKTDDYLFHVEYKSYGKHNTTGERATDLNGKRNIYYNELGTPINNWWTDVKPIINWNKERTGYPTQKPLALLERIIKASSKEGDVVLDPFCGCATTCIASEKLNRQWIGIDVSVKAYELVKQRLKKEVDDKFDFSNKKESKGIKIYYFHESPRRTDRGEGDLIYKYVYIVSNPKFEEGMYKVGVASNMKSRLNSYQTSDPDRKYQLEYKRYTAYFREIEKHIHDKFENKLEWVKGNLQNIIEEIENFKPEEKKKNPILFDNKK